MRTVTVFRPRELHSVRVSCRHQDEAGKPCLYTLQASPRALKAGFPRTCPLCKAPVGEEMCQALDKLVAALEAFAESEGLDVGFVFDG